MGEEKDLFGGIILIGLDRVLVSETRDGCLIIFNVLWMMSPLLYFGGIHGWMVYLLMLGSIGFTI